MAYNTFNPIVYKGLVLYLDAENLKSYSGSGLNWYDLTSNGNNGVLTNGATFSLSGNSIQFDGVNDYVSISNSNILTPNEITLSAWINRTQLGYYSQVMGVPINDVSWNNPFRRYGFEFIDSTNTMGFTLGFTDNTYQSVTCNTFGLYEWFNITGTYDGSTINVYINGVLSTSVPETKALINSTSNFYIGSENTSSIYPFIGKIGCVHLYNRALTPAEILQNYNATKWRFINELPSIVTDQLVLNLDAGDTSSYPGSGTTWYDLTVNNNDGVLTNGVTYDSVVGDGSMIFDGVNDFVNLGTSVGKLVQFTISIWLKPDNWNNCGIVFSSNTGGGQASTHWGLWGRVSGNMEIYVSNGSSYQSANTSLPWSSSDIPNSSFTNIVITVDGSNIRIFKNSIQIGSDIAQTISQSGTAYDLCVGKNPADSGYFYDGYISDVLVYSKALTSTEVLQNFNAQKNRYGL